MSRQGYEPSISGIQIYSITATPSCPVHLMITFWSNTSRASHMNQVCVQRRGSRKYVQIEHTHQIIPLRICPSPKSSGKSFPHACNDYILLQQLTFPSHHSVQPPKIRRDKTCMPRFSTKCSLFFRRPEFPCKRCSGGLQTLNIGKSL
jgi:hypothetical protein